MWTQGGSLSRCGNVFKKSFIFLKQVKRGALTIVMTVQLILRHLRCDTLCQTWRIRKRRREMERPDLVGPIRPHPNIRLRAASSPRRDEIYHLEKNKLRNKFRQSSGNFCWNYLNPLERATSWCRVSNPFWTIHSRNGAGSLKFAKTKTLNKFD